VADGLSLVTLFGCVLLWILRLPVKKGSPANPRSR